MATPTNEAVPVTRSPGRAASTEYERSAIRFRTARRSDRRRDGLPGVREALAGCRCRRRAATDPGIASGADGPPANRTGLCDRRYESPGIRCQSRRRGSLRRCRATATPRRPNAASERAVPPELTERAYNVPDAAVFSTPSWLVRLRKMKPFRKHFNACADMFRSVLPGREYDLSWPIQVLLWLAD